MTVISSKINTKTHSHHHHLILLTKRSVNVFQTQTKEQLCFDALLTQNKTDSKFRHIIQVCSNLLQWIQFLGAL